MRVTAALSGTPNETLPTGEATTRIQVNYQGQSTSCTVVVSPKSALSLSTSEVKMMGKAGGTTYDFYVLGINDVSKLKVSSRNSSVATVQLVDAKDPRGAKYRITAQPNKNPAEMGAMGTQITYIDVEYNGAKKYFRAELPDGWFPDAGHHSIHHAHHRRHLSNRPDHHRQQGQ